MDAGGSQLLVAARKGDLVNVNQLVHKGTYVNYQDRDGMTALTFACREGHWEIATVLLQNGAEATIRSHSGWTAEDYARQNNQNDIVQLLQQQQQQQQHLAAEVPESLTGLPTVSKEMDPAGPQLKVAAWKGDLVNVKRLLRQGTAVNYQDEDGLTVLMWACGHREIVRVLLQNGADTTIRNTDGNTAEDLARKNNQNDIVQLLQQHQQQQHVVEFLMKVGIKEEDSRKYAAAFEVEGFETVEDLKMLVEERPEDVAKFISKQAYSMKFVKLVKALK